MRASLIILFCSLAIITAAPAKAQTAQSVRLGGSGTDVCRRLDPAGDACGRSRQHDYGR